MSCVWAGFTEEDSYVFPFEPNPSWSKFYVGGAEIQKYILETTEKYGLKEKIIFNTELCESTWEEQDGKWKLKLKNNGCFFQDEADILINATGVLRYENHNL